MDQVDKLGLDASGMISGLNAATASTDNYTKSVIRSTAANFKEAQSFDLLMRKAKDAQLLSGMPLRSGMPSKASMVGGAMMHETAPNLKIFQSGQQLMKTWGESASASMARATKETFRARNEAAKLAFSWRMAIRIFESFVIYRGLYAIGQVLTDAVSSATEFQIKISQIRTISQENQLSMEGWAKGIRAVSDQFGLPIMDTAAATYEAVSNQIAQGAKSLEFMQEVGKLAISTNSTMADSQNALAGVMNAYSLSVDDAGTIASKFFVTIDKGRIKMADLGNQIGDVAAVAGLLGVDLNELLASISEITIRSVTPSHALTQLRNIMMQMLKPSQAMKQSFADIGVETASIGIKTYGFMDFMKRLADTKGDMEGLAEIFRNIRGYAGAAILTSAEGFGRLQETTAAITNSVKAYEQAVKISTESTGKQMQMQLNHIKTYFTEALGGTILRYIKSYSDEFMGFDNVLKGLVDTIRLALLPALAAVGWLMISKILPMVKTHPYILLTTSILALAAAIHTLMVAYKEAGEQEIKAHMQAWDAVQKARMAAYRETITNAGQSLASTNQTVYKEVATLVAGLNTIQKKVIESDEKITEELKDSLQTTEDAIRTNVTDVNNVLSNTKSKIEEIKNALQDLKEESRKREVNIALEDKKPAEQVAILRDEVVKLTKEGLNAKTFDDMKFSFEEAKKYADQIKDITDKTYKDRRSIEKEITREHDKYERIDTKLRKEEQRKPHERSEIEKQRMLAKAESKKIIDDLRSKLGDLGELPINPEQANTALKNIAKMQEDAYKKAGRKLVESQKTQTDELEKYKRIEAEITEIQRAQNNTKFEDILKNENIKAVQSEFKIRDDLYSKQIKLYSELGMKYTKQRYAVEDKQFEERKAIEDELNKRNVTAKQEELRLKEEALKKSFSALSVEASKRQEMLIKLQRQRELGEAKFEQRAKAEGATNAYNAWKAGKYGPEKEGYEKLMEWRRESYKEAQLMSPEMFDAEIKNAETRANTAKAAIEEFLKSLPVAVKESVTAVVVQTGVMTSLTDAIGAARDAFAAQIDAVNALTVALQKAAANIPKQPKNAPVEEAFGGMISRGTDSVLALLSPGEYVMNKKATRRFYSQLVAMNSTMPAFSSGGPVSNTFSGDFNISLQSSGNATVDVQHIGRLLQREIRRGTVKL